MKEATAALGVSLSRGPGLGSWGRGRACVFDIHVVPRAHALAIDRHAWRLSAPSLRLSSLTPRAAVRRVNNDSTQRCSRRQWLACRRGAGAQGRVCQQDARLSNRHAPGALLCSASSSCSTSSAQAKPWPSIFGPVRVQRARPNGKSCFMCLFWRGDGSSSTVWDAKKTLGTTQIPPWERNRSLGGNSLGIFGECHSK